MLLILVIAFFLALALGGVCVVFGKPQAHIYSEKMPQRFHFGSIPRLGSVAIAGGTILAWLAACGLHSIAAINHVPIDWHFVFCLILIGLPAVTLGFLDDMTQKIGVRWRLLGGAGSAALACILLDASVLRVGIAPIDAYLGLWPALGFAIAFIGMTTMPHAFNMIDGYNGLAGIVAVMICSALTYVALVQGDRELAGILVCIIGATLGFLVWNYPRGLIFAGDAGAYFWGILIAVLSILLVQRHPAVSPWFVFLLLIYPTSEALFSIYRKLARGQSPGQADSMHFHQLIYKRIVRGVVHDDATRQILMRNNRTSPYLWFLAMLSVIPAVLFWYSTPILIFFSLLFVLSYIVAYKMIVRFKVPTWLRRK